MPYLEAISSIFSGTEPTDNPRNRRFLIERYPRSFQPEDIEVQVGHWIYLACPDSPYKCDHCNSHAGHIDCLVVAIDSDYPKNPSTGDKVSVGIFFGYDNNNNLSTTVYEEHCTAQVASLKACSLTLSRFSALQMNWKSENLRDGAGSKRSWPMHTLVIKSDSEYLIKGVTEWMPKWKSNGWKNCKGQPVANDKLWRSMDEMIVHLERKMNVQFWLVKKSLNLNARYLALSSAQNL